MESVLTWMSGSWLAHLVLDHFWVFGTLETLHFLGLILLVGSLLIVDLRMLGVVPGIPMDAVLAFLPWSFVGFGINFVTGVMFFFSDPFHYYESVAFRWKMLAIAAAGVNVIWFKHSIHPRINAAGRSSVPAQTKYVATLSLALWLAVIVFGRMIPYLGPGGG